MHKPDLRLVRAVLAGRVLPGELEGSVLASASDETCRHLAEAIGPGTPGARRDLTTWLGNNKSPWLRALVADLLPWPEIDDVVADIMTGWMDGAKGTDEARGAFSALRAA